VFLHFITHTNVNISHYRLCVNHLLDFKFNTTTIVVHYHLLQPLVVRLLAFRVQDPRPRAGGFILLTTLVVTEKFCYYYTMLFVISLGILGIILLVSPVSALAQCPICIVTVGGGMLIARKLGIDDLLVSIWISALNVAISFWLAPKLKIKVPVLKYLDNGHVLAVVLLLTTLAYFQFTGQLGHPANRLFSIDKVVFGQILGTLAMMAANHTYQKVKTKLGHTPFPYAKVAFPLGTVLLITLVFKFAFKL
jgi:hypothetical protein